MICFENLLHGICLKWLWFAYMWMHESSLFLYQALVHSQTPSKSPIPLPSYIRFWSRGPKIHFYKLKNPKSLHVHPSSSFHFEFLVYKKCRKNWGEKKKKRYQERREKKIKIKKILNIAVITKYAHHLTYVICRQIQFIADTTITPIHWFRVLTRISHLSSLKHHHCYLRELSSAQIQALSKFICAFGAQSELTSASMMQIQPH